MEPQICIPRRAPSTVVRADVGRLASPLLSEYLRYTTMHNKERVYDVRSRRDFRDLQVILVCSSSASVSHHVRGFNLLYIPDLPKLSAFQVPTYCCAPSSTILPGLSQAAAYHPGTHLLALSSLHIPYHAQPLEFRYFLVPMNMHVCTLSHSNSAYPPK